MNKGKSTFGLKNMPVSGSGNASAGAGGVPCNTATGSKSPPSGGKQTSGPASRARAGVNLAGKGENLNSFPSVGNSAPKIQS